MNFAMKNLTAGELNALVKEVGGEDVVRNILNKTVQFVIQTVEAASKLVRQVRVDRTRTAAQAINATRRHKWYIDEEVLAEMPTDGPAEVIIEFFELDYDPSVDELDREYEARGFRPDPAAVAQAMTDDPAFADEQPLAVQWRDKRGRACCALFDRDDGERSVGVGRNDGRWLRSYRFAGVRK